ncbi:MAG: hypothetical protein WAT78_14305 [Rhizobiaceae bacterium]
MPSEVKRLRQLEEENAKLKRLVADLGVNPSGWTIETFQTKPPAGRVEFRILLATYSQGLSAAA